MYQYSLILFKFLILSNLNEFILTIKKKCVLIFVRIQKKDPSMKYRPYIFIFSLINTYTYVHTYTNEKSTIVNMLVYTFLTLCVECAAFLTIKFTWSMTRLLFGGTFQKLAQPIELSSDP